MSDAISKLSLRNILNELVSGRLSLHMTNEVGEWIDEVVPEVAHAQKHFAQASRDLIDLMAEVHTLLFYLHVEDYEMSTRLKELLDY